MVRYCSCPWLLFYSSTSKLGKYFRIGRLLRPLRIIGKHQGMQLILTALIQSRKELLYSLWLIIIMFVIFGILGIGLFAGKYACCNDESIQLKSNFLDPSTGIFMPRAWIVPSYHFNHIGAAMLTLFEVITGKEWVRIMYQAMDITKIDHQPKP